MLTQEQYLLICLMEECSEVAQAASKCLRFGTHDHCDEVKEDNAVSLLTEVTQFCVLLDKLHDMGVLPNGTDWADRVEKMYDEKMGRVMKYMEYSRSKGIVE